jgi:hypothetical protein
MEVGRVERGLLFEKKRLAWEGQLISDGDSTFVNYNLVIDYPCLITAQKTHVRLKAFIKIENTPAKRFFSP